MVEIRKVALLREEAFGEMGHAAFSVQREQGHDACGQQ